MTTILKALYRPTENHVGIIYSKWGKFRRFANPNEWTLLSPAFEFVAKEVRLDMRTAMISLENVLTLDKVAVDLEMKVFYSVDVRKVQADRLIQVLRFESESVWEEIVKTGITDIARNVILIAHRFDELVTWTGLSFLKQALSSALAHRVQGFGIQMNRYAVNIMNFQPNETFQQALQEESAARTLGNAAAARLRPVLEQFGDQEQKQALLALVMQIASAVAKNGQSPDIMFPNTEEFFAGHGAAGNRTGPINPNVPRVSQSSRPKSVAGD